MRKLRLGIGVAALLVGLAIQAFGQSTWPNPSDSRSVIQGGEWTIKHIGSTVHVSGALTATVDTIKHISAVTHVAGYGTFQTRAHESSALAHVSSVTHVAGYGTFQVSLHGTSTIAHISSVTHIVGVTRFHYSGALRAWQVNACGGTAAMAVATNTDRRDLILQNLGGAAANSERNVIFVGFGTTGHVALTTANGYPLPVHMAASGVAPVTYMSTSPPLVIPNYQGPVACITNQNTGILSVIEVLR